MIAFPSPRLAAAARELSFDVRLVAWREVAGQFRVAPGKFELCGGLFVLGFGFDDARRFTSAFRSKQNLENG